MASGTLNTRSVARHEFGNASSAVVGIINAASSTTFAGRPQVGAGERWGIYAMLVGVAAATTLTVQDTAGNPYSQPFNLLANDWIVLDMQANGDAWWQAARSGLGLQLALNPAVACGFDVYWLPAQ